MFRSCIKVFSKTTIRKCSRKASLIFWQTTWKHLCRSTSSKFLQKKTCFARNESRSQEHHLYKILLVGCSNVFSNGFFFVRSVSAHEANQNRNLSCSAVQFLCQFVIRFSRVFAWAKFHTWAILIRECLKFLRKKLSEIDLICDTFLMMKYFLCHLCHNKSKTTVMIWQLWWYDNCDDMAIFQIYTYHSPLLHS